MDFLFDLFFGPECIGQTSGGPEMVESSGRRWQEPLGVWVKEGKRELITHTRSKMPAVISSMGIQIFGKCCLYVVQISEQKYSAKKNRPQPWKNIIIKPSLLYFYTFSHLADALCKISFLLHFLFILWHQSSKILHVFIFIIRKMIQTGNCYLSQIDLQVTTLWTLHNCQIWVVNDVWYCQNVCLHQ